MSHRNLLQTDDVTQLIPRSPDGSLRAGLPRLLRAYEYAQDAQTDPWEFALEIDKLYALGLMISDLRWFAVKGFAKHGQETSDFDDRHRSFRTSNYLNTTYNPPGGVAGDVKLQKWYNDLVSENGGRVKGFGESGALTTREYLIDGYAPLHGTRQIRGRLLQRRRRQRSLEELFSRASVRSAARFKPATSTGVPTRR